MINRYPIGGDLYFSYFNKKNKNFLKSEKLFWLNSGKSCLEAIYMNLPENIDKIVIPEYICLESYNLFFKKKKFNISFYKIDEYLNFDLSNFQIDQNSAIVFVNYFGIKEISKKLKKIKIKYNPIIIYDLVQAPQNFISFFLSKKITNFEYIDFAFTSFKKSYAIPNGSCLYSKKPIDIKKKSGLNKIDKLWKNAINEKQNYISSKRIDIEIEKNYLDLFNNVKKLNNNGIFTISKLSLSILKKLNFKLDRAIRRKNYNLFVSILKKNKNLTIPKKKLDKDDTPLFLPIFFQNKRKRDYFKNFLIKNSIFFPIHWKTIKETINNYNLSSEMYDNELSIIIDGRINKHIKTICNLLKKKLK